MARSRRVEIGWSRELADGTEEEFRVVGSWTPGSPGRGPNMNGPGEPPEAPEFEVLDVYEEGPGGKKRPDLLALVLADLDRLHEEACEQVDEEAFDDHDRACDDARDAALDFHEED
jgi:hypothetical protein